MAQRRCATLGAMHTARPRAMPGVVPWPADVAQRYRGLGLWTGVTLGDAIDRSISVHADRIAVVDGARRLTYRELGELSNRLALHLAGRGIADGARAIF